MLLLRRIMTGLIAVTLVGAALGLGVRVYMSRAAEERLRPGEAISIAVLAAPLPRPSFLACPPGYCHVAGAEQSPIFDVPWRALQAAFARVAAAAPRTRRVADEADRRREVFIQRSALFRFPDIITVEFVPLGADRSSLAIFSRSRYGRDDFGVNRARVEGWLARLGRIASPSS